MSVQKKQSGIKLFGNFRMRVYDRSKKILDWKKRNQITNQGRETILILLCPFGVSGTPDAQTEHRIWSLAAGTNGTPTAISDDDGTMIAVWTSALNFVGAECVVSATPPNSFYLQISKILPLAEAVGSELKEAGIFTRGDDIDPAIAVGRKLYARQVHTPIIKTATMSIQYDWQLGVSVSSSS